MPDYVVEFGSGDDAPENVRLDAGAFHRNHQPIWAILSQFLSGRGGNVLELGSGTGQHIVEFARQTPAITWWPSDLNEKHLRSIDAWRVHSRLANVRPPVRIDLTDHAPSWQKLGLPDQFLAMFCANVIHIAPWAVALGLFALASRRLRHDGALFLYGPFMRDGQHTAPSNAAFDASLRQRDPDWGVRDITDLRDAAAAEKLGLAAAIDMPANNMILRFDPS